MKAAEIPDLSVEAFERGEIDSERFDHEAHVFVAWLYLERYPLLTAIEKFDTALRQLTLKLGVPGKYHATITWFFMLLIEQRRKDEPGSDWARFRADNNDLIANGSMLKHYYTKETLQSERARQSFVLPDRCAA